ncbi:MAG: hypothetical protein AAF772_01685 [Acidobacteriota bacterium]
MSRKDKEALIKAWKEGTITSPAGAVKLDDDDLQRVAGGCPTGGPDPLLTAAQTQTCCEDTIDPYDTHCY